MSWDYNKQRELNKLITELPKKSFELNEECKDMYDKLKAIYEPFNSEDTFRHKYSELFGIIAQVDLDKTHNSGDLQILLHNLEYLYKYHTEFGDSLFDKTFNKLYDHINLEVSRLNYSESRNLDYTEQLKKFNKQTESLDIKINDQKERLEKSQVDFIAMLGIFASIVLAFTGGMTFSTSVFSNIHKASVYRVIALADIVGLTFFSIIWLLFVFVIKIKDRNNTQQTKLTSTTFGFIFGFFILLLGLDFFAYKKHWLDEASVPTSTIYEQIIIHDQNESEDMK